MSSVTVKAVSAAIFLAGTSLGSPAFAQGMAVAAAATAADSIIVSGRVLDEDGRALPGAEVRIDALGLATRTGVQGEFSLVVPVGDHSLTVDYIGKANLMRDISAGADSRALELVMLADDAIVVTGAILGGTARALNQQRTADNGVVVLSADDVGRFPDPNIAEALQRVAGVSVERDQGEGRYVNVRGAPAEFSTVSVDGVTISAVDPTTRAVDLDTIPSDIVNNLEITKTLLPSQGADSISGAINIKTRSPFDSKRTRVNLSGGGSINQFGGHDVRASGVVSTRFGGDSNFGILVNASYSRTDRRPDNVENVWVRLNRPEGGQIFGIEETLFKDYDTRRERLAFAGSLEYQSDGGDKLYVRANFNRFEDDEFRNTLGIIWADGTLLPGATNSSARFSSGRIQKQFRHRVQRNEILSLTGGGEHQLGLAEIDYHVGYTTSEQNFPSRNELLYRSSLRPTLSYDTANPNTPTYSLFTSNEHLDVSRYGFRENAFRDNITENEEWSGGVNLKVPMGQVQWQAGVHVRDRTVEADEERFRDRAAGAAPATSFVNLLGSVPSVNYDYLLGRKFNPGLVIDYFDSARPRSPRRVPESTIADYQAEEQIIAGYVMARADLGATDIIAGVRVERTRFDGTAPTLNSNTGVFGVANASARYTEWFPNLTLRHAFTEQLIGRIALTRGINRPNFIEIVPRAVENTEATTRRVTLGNPALEPTLSNNADASLEYYLPSLGLISAGVFYKDISDYRYEVTRTGSFLGAPALLTQAENAPDGKLYGFEVNWNQRFDFLPGELANFGIFANYTYTKARIELAQAYAGRQRFPLPGQSKHTWNASLFYESKVISARISYTKRSDYLDEINADDGALDFFWEGRGQLDFTASAEVTKNFSVFFEGKNLTNSAGVRYYGDRNRVGEYEKFGYTMFTGIKLNF